jgi:hypothetical protein
MPHITIHRGYAFDCTVRLRQSDGSTPTPTDGMTAAYCVRSARGGAAVKEFPATIEPGGTVRVNLTGEHTGTLQTGPASAWLKVTVTDGRPYKRGEHAVKVV